MGVREDANSGGNVVEEAGKGSLIVALAWRGGPE